jgi:hypothetical protein
MCPCLLSLTVKKEVTFPETTVNVYHFKEKHFSGEVAVGELK